MENSALIAFITGNFVLLALIFAVGVPVVSLLVQRFGMYVWYFGAILVLFLLSALTDNLPYFFAFTLGMATAFAEIISKFADDPLKALKTNHALLYHLVNGSIAAFALWVISINGIPSTHTWDHAKEVLAAGFGSMLIMRSNDLPRDFRTIHDWRTAPGLVEW